MPFLYIQSFAKKYVDFHGFSSWMYSHFILKLVESICMYIFQYVFNCGPVFLRPTVLYFRGWCFGRGGDGGKTPSLRCPGLCYLKKKGKKQRFLQRLHHITLLITVLIFSPFLLLILTLSSPTEGFDFSSCGWHTELLGPTGSRRNPIPTQQCSQPIPSTLPTLVFPIPSTFPAEFR